MNIAYKVRYMESLMGTGHKKYIRLNYMTSHTVMDYNWCILLYLVPLSSAVGH